jgi:adenylate cyclase
MKNRIWLFQLPLIALFAFAFWVHESGIIGELHNDFLRGSVFPGLKRFSSMFLDFKFKIRGERPPRNKIVIVEIDSKSIEVLGRWPWDREVTAFLTERIFEHGAKVVGYDIVFSEPNQKVSDPLRQLLEQNQLGALADNFETDPKLAGVIASNRDRLVLGWMNEGICQPVYESQESCQFDHPDLLAAIPENFSSFGYEIAGAPESMASFTPRSSPFVTPIQLIPNMPLFNNLARYQGTLETQPDPDGVIRRANAIRMVGRSLQKPIAFAMAEAGSAKPFIVTLKPDHRLASIQQGLDGKPLPTTPLGVLSVNYRGRGRSFPYVSAVDLMGEDKALVETEIDHKVTEVNPRELLKDAYVLLGVSAIGLFDMRAFPFDSNVPGVEGHATILDNILSNDFLSYGPLGRERASAILFLLIIFGGTLFAFSVERLESIPALMLGTVTLASLGWVDQKLLFERDIHWDFSFVYFLLFSIFITTNAVKYVLEERNKKFIKGAFSKYVSPAIVDSILKDPTKLTVGGERRDLTILFSDIRGFTTFSEKMDPKALAAFLNDYLGIMTDVVFDTEGTLDKYIGDAVMAFWGAPLDQPKHAANACRAARIMLQKLAEHRERFKTQYGVEVNIGIGVNSGLVNVGNMGSERIFEYTVIGDHVNLASRLEGLTKYYGAGIVTTRFTFDMIRQAGETLPPHRTLDSVKVKGKKEAVELIQVLEREYDPEGLKLFEEARQLYLEQHWDDAIDRFKLANEKLKFQGQDDGPTAMYLERCAELKTTGVESDWDGAWKMTSK